MLVLCVCPQFTILTYFPGTLKCSSHAPTAPPLHTRLAYPHLQFKESCMGWAAQVSLRLTAKPTRIRRGSVREADKFLLLDTCPYPPSPIFLPPLHASVTPNSPHGNNFIKFHLEEYSNTITSPPHLNKEHLFREEFPATSFPQLSHRGRSLSFPVACPVFLILRSVMTPAGTTNLRLRVRSLSLFPHSSCGSVIVDP